MFTQLSTNNGNFFSEVLSVLKCNIVNYTLAEGKCICSRHCFNSTIKHSLSYKWYSIEK